MNFPAHGANPEKLYKEFDILMPSKIIDFSTNTNAIDYEEKIDVDFCTLINNYPDDECFLLREVIAKTKNYDLDNILVTNGSNEGLYLIASYLNNKRVGVIQPTYTEYEKALKAYGGNVEYLSTLADISEKHEAVFICNPCNPTGEYIKAEVLEKTIESYSKIILIIDEAYIDFLSEEDKEIDFIRLKNVYILRSLTKIYHLSGARIGYVISAKENIANLKRRQPTWSVNAIAQALAVQYLSNKTFINKTKTFYFNERQRVVSILQKLGFEIMKSDVNFFLLITENDLALISYLLKKGIVVRHTRNIPSLDGRCIRISLKTQVENDILINCLKEYKR
jgi:threonine-phosphate decarboxylase